MTPTTRRRFLELVPLAGTVLVAACSPAPAPAPPVAAVDTPPAPAPAPVAPAAAPSAPATAQTASPASGVTLDEKDPQAVALSYVSDASRVDKTKSPNFVAGSRCGNCAVYQGAASDTSGPCPLYQGKRVSVNGWCSAWSKKA